MSKIVLSIVDLPRDISPTNSLIIDGTTAHQISLSNFEQEQTDDDIVTDLYEITMAAYYTFEDYSGTSTPNKSDNPYDGLIENCNNDPVRSLEDKWPYKTLT